MAQAAVDCTISTSQGDALFYSMLQRGVALCPEIGLHGEHALTAAFAVIRMEFLISARALEISGLGIPGKRIGTEVSWIGVAAAAGGTGASGGDGAGEVSWVGGEAAGVSAGAIGGAAGVSGGREDDGAVVDGVGGGRIASPQPRKRCTDVVLLTSRVSLDDSHRP